MFLAFIHWGINPEIFHVTLPILGLLSVRWYGLLFATSFYFGYVLFNRFIKLENMRIELLDRLILYVGLGTVIGARLGHCFFYDARYYLENPLEIIAIWHGGLASHGAAIGILIAIYFFVKKEKVTYLWTMDRVVVTVALAGFFIRMGNLMNSEIYGVQTSLPWGFIFVREGETLPKHPTQIYEALSYLLIFILLIRLYYHYKSKPKEGLLFGLFLILIFTMRFLIEFIKNTQEDFEKALPLDMGQILSVPLILAGIVILIYAYRKPHPKTE
jgi:prolipoprotein diacylglyceryl transferase